MTQRRTLSDPAKLTMAAIVATGMAASPIALLGGVGLLSTSAAAQEVGAAEAAAEAEVDASFGSNPSVGVTEDGEIVSTSEEEEDTAEPAAALEATFSENPSAAVDENGNLIEEEEAEEEPEAPAAALEATFGENPSAAVDENGDLIEE